MNRKPGILVMLLICAGLVGISSPSAQANPPDWSVQSPVSPKYIEAAAEDALSVLDCDQSYNEGRNGKPAQAFAFRSFVTYSSSVSSGSNSYLPWSYRCTPEATVATPNGTLYSGIYRGGGNTPSDAEAIVKERNGRFLWTTTYQVCQFKTYKYGYPLAMEIGSDGTIFAVLRSSAHYSDCPDKFVLIDPDDGTISSPTDLSSTGSGKTQIWTYSDKVIVADRSGYVYHFDTDGTLEDTDSSLMVGKSVITMWADDSQNVYAHTTAAGCYATQSLRKLVQGSSSTVEYTFPANYTCTLNGDQVAPLSGGSIALLEQSSTSLTITKFSAGSSPVSVTESSFSGYSEIPVRITADGSGKVVYVAQRYDSSTSKVKVIVRLIDFASPSSSIIWDSSTDLSDDDVSSFGAGDIYGDDLYLPMCLSTSACSTNSQSGSKIYKIDLTGFGTRLRTSGAFNAPSTGTQLQYVAMGDSYASGEAEPPFMLGTDISTVNMCHRSKDGYPMMVEEYHDNVELAAFVACSGATTADVLYGDSGTGSWGEGPQVQVLTDDTDIVTLSVGGNDIGFKDYVLSCAVYCSSISDSYTEIMANIEDEAFKAVLVNTYEEILSKAPNAQLYVLNYPYISDENTGMCEGLDFSTSREVQDALNAVIEEAVDEVYQTDISITYVDTNAAGSAFENHVLCNDFYESYFYGLVPTVADHLYSFHPNYSGMEAYREVLEDNIPQIM